MSAAAVLGQLDSSTFYNPYPKQNQLHTSAATNLLGIGGNGSGKSAFLLGEAIFICLEFPGADCLLLRKDFKELEKGLILDLKNTLPKSLYKYNDQKHIVTFANGSHIFFGHCRTGSERDLAQYLSSAFVFIGIDELGQFSYAAYSFLSSRNRINKGCRANANGEWPIPRMGGATNPLGPGYGWIKKVWIDKKPVSQMGEVTERDGKWWAEVKGVEVVVYDPADYFYVHSTVLDNPAQLEKDPRYIEKLMKLPPPLRQKALYGDLNSLAGQYFSNFTQDRHVMSLPRDHDLLEWQPWQKRWIGIDWGLAHFSAVYWATRARARWSKESEWRQVTIIYRELVENEKDYDELCQMIADKTPDDEKKMIKNIYLSPERFSRTVRKDKQHTIGIEMGNHLHENGLVRCEPANDRRIDGAVYMYSKVENDELIVLDTCTALINAFEVVVRDPDNLEDILKTSGVEDDSIEGARYTLLSEAKPRPKTKEVIYNEHLAEIKDPMAARMFSYEHLVKKGQASRVIKPRYKL